jgi:hypothetical protein
MPDLLPPDERREEALKVGYLATDWNAAPPYRLYADALEDWTVRLMTKDGETIGAVYTNGPEFHVSVLPGFRGRWATRGILKEIIPRPVAVTRVAQGHERIGGILERLGFERRDGFYVRECYGH